MMTLIGLLTAMQLFATPAHAEISAVEIMNKNEEARKLGNMEASATLKVSGGTRKPGQKDFTWWRKLNPDGIRFNTLTKFSAPAEVRNEAILLLEKPSGENEILIYFPNLKKVRRVEAQQQSSSFMSSDFSYSDLTAVHVADYDFELKPQEKCPGPEATARQCYLVVGVPKSEDLKIKLGYKKTVSWIRTDNFMLSQVDYYDLAGEKIKRLQAAETRIVDTKLKKFFSHKLRMDQLKKGQRTELDFSLVKTNVSIPDRLFNKQNLGND
jgi:outer membrane lipoprotein-sorting protein